MKYYPLLFLFTFALSACFTSQKTTQHMKTYAFRLTPGQDLRKEIEAFASRENLHAGFVITCVGSLQQVNIRPANQQTPLTRTEKFEIVSLVGTLSPDGVHLHIALSDSLGNTIGGHLLEGNLIYTTAEIVLGEAESLRFSREIDPVTTFKELKVNIR
jgi:predicted DNA-binding protein with PD1-like motif